MITVQQAKTISKSITDMHTWKNSLKKEHIYSDWMLYSEHGFPTQKEMYSVREQETI